MSLYIDKSIVFVPRKSTGPKLYNTRRSVVIELPRHTPPSWGRSSCICYADTLIVTIRCFLVRKLQLHFDFESTQLDANSTCDKTDMLTFTAVVERSQRIFEGWRVLGRYARFCNSLSNKNEYSSFLLFYYKRATHKTKQ